MGVRWRKGRYSHYYRGKRNSRGRRAMSKIYKGIKPGNLERVFRELELEAKKQKISLDKIKKSDKIIVKIRKVLKAKALAE